MDCSLLKTGLNAIGVHVARGISLAKEVKINVIPLREEPRSLPNTRMRSPTLPPAGDTRVTRGGMKTVTVLSGTSLTALCRRSDIEYVVAVTAGRKAVILVSLIETMVAVTDGADTVVVVSVRTQAEATLPKEVPVKVMIELATVSAGLTLATTGLAITSMGNGGDVLPPAVTEMLYSPGMELADCKRQRKDEPSAVSDPETIVQRYAPEEMLADKV